MPLDKQDLDANTVLVGTYKKQAHRVLVVGEPGPEQGYELDGETTYKSLSSAAKAVMGGISANGWRFWSLEGDTRGGKLQMSTFKCQECGKAFDEAAEDTCPHCGSSDIDLHAPQTEKPAKGAGGKRSLVQVRKLPNQKGAPEGQTRWFCSSCMAAFNATTGVRPEECPEGHPRVLVDDLS
jgi:DNA-directed RNA polymerase subunit RPC12/RpoP